MSVIWSGLTEEGVLVPVQVTAEGKVVAVGDGPEGDYLKLTGGNLTGALTLGANPSTPNISLNATDGSASFADDVSLIQPDGDNVFLRVGNTSTTSTGLVAFSSDKSSIGGNIRYEGSAVSSPFEPTQLAFQNGIADTNGGQGFGFYGSGNRYLAKINDAGDMSIGGTLPSSPNISLNADGSTIFAGNKCGFTSNGEVYFMSGSTRYKIVVSNGICQAEEYSVAREVKEKAEQFVADKRETKPSDSSNPSNPSDPSDPQGEVTMDNDNA